MAPGIPVSGFMASPAAIFWSTSRAFFRVFEEYVKDGATLKSTALAITAKYGEQFNKKFSIGTIEHILTFEPYCTGIKVVSLTDPDTEDVSSAPSSRFAAKTPDNPRLTTCCSAEIPPAS